MVYEHLLQSFNDSNIFIDTGLGKKSITCGIKTRRYLYNLIFKPYVPEQIYKCNLNTEGIYCLADPCAQLSSMGNKLADSEVIDLFEWCDRPALIAYLH